MDGLWSCRFSDAAVFDSVARTERLPQERRRAKEANRGKRFNSSSVRKPFKRIVSATFERHCEWIKALREPHERRIGTTMRGTALPLVSFFENCGMRRPSEQE
jgi:hypothetical protein